MSEKDYKKTIQEQIKKKGLNFKAIAEQMELTKFALSKIIHNKQKMYLDEFLELADILGLFSANNLLEDISADDNDDIFASFLMLKDILVNGKISDDNISFICTSLIKQHSHIFAEKFAAKDLDEALNDLYCLEICEIPDFIFYNNPNDINDYFKRHQTLFSPKEYLEYQKLKNQAYMIENQYVFNLSDLTSETEEQEK